MLIFGDVTHFKTAIFCSFFFSEKKIQDSIRQPWDAHRMESSSVHLGSHPGARRVGAWGLPPAGKMYQMACPAGTPPSWMLLVVPWMLGKIP